MYNQFCKNFYNYLKLNRNELYNNEYNLSILEPFYGLSNTHTYEQWKISSDIRYYELSNLIYEMKKHADQFHSFVNFYHELYGYGYDSIKSYSFDKSKIQDQLKLTNLLLGTYYWMSASN